MFGKQVWADEVLPNDADWYIYRKPLLGWTGSCYMWVPLRSKWVLCELYIPSRGKITSSLNKMVAGKRGSPMHTCKNKRANDNREVNRFPPVTTPRSGTRNIVYLLKHSLLVDCHSYCSLTLLFLLADESVLGQSPVQAFSEGISGSLPRGVKLSVEVLCGSYVRYISARSAFL